MAERKNALARAPEVAFRASMLPVGNYEDGSIAFPVRPQGWLDLVDSWRQFTNAAEAARGIPHTAEESFPRDKDAILAGAAMTGAGIGGLGSKAAGRAVSGTAPESAAASRTLPSHSVESGSPIIDPQIAAGDAAAAAVPDTRSWWQKTTGSGEAELGIARLEARKAAMRADAIEGLRDVPPSGPIRAKVYRGASRDEQWPPSSYEGKAFWASDNRDAASAYAGTPGDNAVTNWLIDTQGFDQARIPKGHITPAEIAFQKPLVLDAKGGQWGNIKVGNRNYYTDQLADLAREFGHDGLVVRNVVDDAPAGTTYAALQPGTVRSATTGETLFSNPKEAAPAGLLATDQKNDSMPQQSDFDRAFSELDAALIDLDGDGVPDVQVPRNALAGDQVPQRLVPRGAQPIQPGFEMLPSDVPQRPMNALTGGGAQPQTNALSPPMNAAERGADEMMPRYRGPMEAPPQQGFVARNLNALANYTNGIVKDVTDDPVGAAWGAVNFATGYGASGGEVRNAMLRPFDKTARGLVQRELRSYTESGARKNGLEQVEIGARRAQEARDAFNAHPDVVMSRQPHQQLQGRDPKTGRWQKFTDEVREARDRGVELRRRDQAGTDLAKKWSEGSN